MKLSEVKRLAVQRKDVDRVTGVYASDKHWLLNVLPLMQDDLVLMFDREAEEFKVVSMWKFFREIQNMRKVS